jgi:putative addiction module CopG family antidote
MPGRTGKALTITLTKQMAERVRARVASGQYASESEVIRDGLRLLDRRDTPFVGDIEAWMNAEGARVVKDYEAGRLKTAPADEAFARIRKRMAARRRKPAPKT